MKKYLTLFLIITGAMCVPQYTASKNVKIKLIETSDVHGNYFPYDFINQKEGRGSLARVHSLIKEARQTYDDDHLLILDNGDFLQGQPTAYFYNFIDTTTSHLGARMLEYMGYDAFTLGNHDIETGHNVYDRWIKSLSIPVLGANIIDTSTGEPYVKPYLTFDIEGVKIAVLGMITPGIPGWLPENLWEGLEFEDMVETAFRWVPYIQEVEKPHLLIGMFHSGRDYTKTVNDIPENQSVLVAEEVPGFDIILMGHDHSMFLDFVQDPNGKDVLVANPANNANNVIVVDINVELDEEGDIKDLSLNGQSVNMGKYEPSAEFLEVFDTDRKAVENFVEREVGVIADTMTTRDAFFGPSAFVDFIHTMQLAISGAKISMAAPLTYDATIPAGPITVADMFNLYKYENMLYTMALTGQEIKDYLEMSYDLWTNEMQSDEDHLLKIRDTSSNDMTHTGFINPSYNFDSAAGLIYTVDVTKPKGEKISILSMADGTPFDLGETYTVAINSYRGNGGGNLLTEGAGIEKDELTSRIIKSTDKDLRFYLMQYIEEQGEVEPKALNQWKFIPENIVTKAAERDRKLLFGDL